MLAKIFICLSNLLYIIPILIVKKLKKGLQICVDYCILNIFTIKNWNTLFLFQETFAYFFLAQIYSKFDIIITFNEIRI